MKVAYFRGLAAAAVARDPNTNGTMMSVGLSQNEILPILEDLSANGHRDLHIGCINSPNNVTIAGNRDDIDALKSILDEKAIFARKLKVPCAYHSPHMVENAKAYLSQAGKLDARHKSSGSIPLISYLTGEEAPGDRLREIDYWVDNFCSAVNFEQSLGRIDHLASIANAPKKLDLSHRKGVLITNILEIGPHSALQGPIRDILQTFKFAHNIQYNTALVRQTSALGSFLKAVGGLQCSGFDLNISNLTSDHNTEKVSPLSDLPAYPFAHSRKFWSESRRSKNQRLRRYKPNELLGVSSPDSNPFFASWRNFLSRLKSTWIEDHIINNVVLYPGAGMLAMAIEAMNQHTKETLKMPAQAFCLKDVEFVAAMRIPEAPAELETHTYLRICGEKKFKPGAWYEFNILSCEDDLWKVNCKGLIKAEIRNEDYKAFCRPPGDSSASKSTDLSTSEFYDRIRQAGYIYGPSFQRISGIQWSGQGEPLGAVKVFDRSQGQPQAEIFGYEMTRVSGLEQDPLQKVFQEGVHTCWRPSWKAIGAVPNNESHDTEIKLGSGSTRKDQKRTNAAKLQTAEVHVHSATPSVLRLASTLQSKLEADAHISCTVINSHKAVELEGEADIRIILWDVDRESILANLTEHDLVALKRIFDTRKSILWLQTADQLSPNFSSQHLIDGLSRVIRLERTLLNFATLLTESKGALDRAQVISRVCQNLLSGDDASNVPQTFRETSTGDIEFCSLVEATEVTKIVRAARLAPEPEPTPWDIKTPLKMVVGSPGVLDTTHFIEDLEPRDPLLDNEIEVEVKAVGVNFKDCLIALGALNEKSIGSEIAGVVTRIGRDTTDHGLRPNSRVFGFSTNGYRTIFRNHAKGFSVIPESLTFTEAASIPINYATAWHSLRHVAQLAAGETVLIHSGAGGTGQAAIQIAQYLGATVFTTVGTDEKRKILTTVYGIPSDHIFDSRDSTGFAKGVMRMTNGNGVDVVFNSLSGDMLFNSWECIAPFGRFIEIGKKDIQASNGLPMAQFEKNCSFSAVDLGHMFLQRPEQVTRLINEVVDLFNKGRLQTVFPIHRFGISSLVSAFRLMQSGKSSGKIVVETESQSHVQAILPTKAKSSFHPNASYVIAGGLGGLGRDTARWMAERGAKCLILITRTGPKTQQAQELISELRSIGSAPFAEMKHSDWTETLACKVSGSWNLHNLLPKDLDFFVLLSSVQGIIGSRTQSNYAAANTYQDALAQHRVSCGLKAVSLQLGLMDTDGYLAEHEDEKQMMLAQQTYIPVLRSEFHALLDHFCASDLDSTALGSEQLAIGLRLLNINPELDPLGTSWGKNPMFQALRRISAEVSESGGTSLASQFAAASSTAEAVRVVIAALTERLASTIAGTAPEDIEESKAVQAYGVDSLQTMELRSWFLKSFQSDLPAFEILGASSLTALARVIVERSHLRAKQ
ncbi:hypothetical protein TWF696_002607 [Orbilia brochopaga]|uniref:Carrier domain-containing protein n=1 Tax=Orbilia brochopaga TaxID=3140254 RepID=A0AAV9U6D8_9PEZI